ncbi:ATP-binding protein [Bifidobacterium saguinibicoloris]|uniref:ATP-binding protein n=1 Tax=Bifidobacterium saguinibicoloris TaxID=2834433 RepID=UPI001C58FB9C|nr:DUF4143 domain-containing protein [Bifidobacterium saguinibicoloris]MBW3081326.1 ATP-binding protein [Bifidobacterium saguinibicoloris]
MVIPESAGSGTPIGEKTAGRPEGIRPAGYRPRIVDEQIERYMRIFGAVEIAGTKWCGKTWSARAHGASITYVDRNNNLAVAKADPSLMLIGDRPHVIDEWQLAPGIWDEVRHGVDDEPGEKGRWLLTGSSTPLKQEMPQHSGAGRIGRIRMNPMTLAESGISNGAVSLAALFDHRFASARCETDTRTLLDAVCRGGWPEAEAMPVVDAQILIREYVRLTLSEGVAKQGRNPDVARRLLDSLARNISQAVTFKTLRKDMYGAEENLDDFVSERTVSEYVAMFENMFVIDPVRGWVPPARDPKRLQTKPRRYFADPSIAAAVLGVGPAALLDDWQTFGLLFENLCVRDLLVYARALPDIGMEPVRYYHDDSGLECDVIIELADGRWAGVEIKASEDKVPAAAANLNRMREKLLRNPGARTREPEFLAVLVGVGEFAYRREDGIYVIPVATLGR